MAKLNSFHNGIYKDYAYYYLLHQTPAFRQVNQGMGQPNLNTSILAGWYFPLPPIAEQHRIVAKVDQLMKLCDKLEARLQKKREACVTINNTAIAQLLTAREPEEFNKSWQRIYNNFDLLYSTPENIGKLRSCILQLAVMGKLAPQDPHDEPASVLLDKIKTEKELLLKKGKSKHVDKVLALKSDEVLFELPLTWEWVKLGQIVTSLKYGTSKKCFYETDGTPVLRIPNLDNGNINIEDLKFTVLSKNEYEELKLFKDDLLMIRSNGSTSLVGRTAVVGNNADSYAYAGYLVRIRLPSQYIYARYLHLALETNYVREQIEIPIRTTSGVKNINSTEISNLIVPLPPLDEQHRIVAKVNQLMTLCDKLEAQLKQSVANSERLMEITVSQLLDINTIAVDDISVEPTTLETNTVKHSTKKIQSYGEEAVQLNLQLF